MLYEGRKRCQRGDVCLALMLVVKCRLLGSVWRPYWRDLSVKLEIVRPLMNGDADNAFDWSPRPIFRNRMAYYIAHGIFVLYVDHSRSVFVHIQQVYKDNTILWTMVVCF